jgi:ribulose-phosphate 3-epimerase
MGRHLLAPSILSADFTCLGEQIQQAEKAGAAWIHVDVMDGHFVPNLSIGPAVVEACRRVTRLPLDVHLMVEKPERFIESFAQAGADHLTVHVESTYHLHRVLHSIRDMGLKAGVTLNPATPLEAIAPVLPMVDLVLVMCVNPGFSGQGFIEAMLPKIRRLRDWLDRGDGQALIEVDGGPGRTCSWLPRRFLGTRRESRLAWIRSAKHSPQACPENDFGRPQAAERQTKTVSVSGSAAQARARRLMHLAHRTRRTGRPACITVTRCRLGRKVRRVAR